MVSECEVVAEIRRIVSQDLEWRGPVEPSQHLLGDLQLDSLGMVILVVGLEDRFRVRLSPQDEAVDTVGELARVVVVRASSAESSARQRLPRPRPERGHAPAGLRLLPKPR